MPGSWNLKEIIKSYDFPAVIDFHVHLYGFAPMFPGQQPCLQERNTCDSGLMMHDQCSTSSDSEGKVNSQLSSIILCAAELH